MNAHARPALDEQRALTIAAFAALIDQQLASPQGALCDGTHVWLLERFIAAGIATVTPAGEATTLTLLGIRARSTGTAWALLRAWQAEARTRLAEGTRP